MLGTKCDQVEEIGSDFKVRMARRLNSRPFALEEAAGSLFGNISELRDATSLQLHIHLHVHRDSLIFALTITAFHSLCHAGTAETQFFRHQLAAP